jgi:hypothetical protein
LDRGQSCVEKNIQVVYGMEDYQGSEDGGDDEMVAFFGAVNPEAIADQGRLKLI